MAVWHHNIEGPPQRSDYMDVEIVRGMIGRGFRLGLYGHQHRAQATPHQVWLPDRERMAVVSAGSLCAGPRDLPTGNISAVQTFLRSPTTVFASTSGTWRLPISSFRGSSWSSAGGATQISTGNRRGMRSVVRSIRT